MGQLKMFGVIPRKPGITKQYFHDHYRHPHGTMGRRISYMRAYTQSHQFHTDLLGPDQSRFEACAEVWMDNAHAGLNFGTEPNYVEHVLPDEPLFVDLEKLEWCFATEDIIHGGVDWTDPDAEYGDKLFRLDERPFSVKLLQFIIRDGADPWEGADDIGLGRRIGALRHVRCHPSPQVHPEGAFCIGVRELYWPTRMAMEEGIAADVAAWEALLNRPAEAVQFFATAERFM